MFVGCLKLGKSFLAPPGGAGKSIVRTCDGSDLQLAKNMQLVPKCAALLPQ